MKVTLDSSSSNLNIVEGNRKIKRMFFKKERDDLVILKSRFFFEIVRLYLEEIRTWNPGSCMVSHSILPLLIQYLLSINVTSVNTERSFSRLKSIYGDHRHTLGEGRAGNELLVSAIATTLGCWCVPAIDPLPSH